MTVRERYSSVRVGRAVTVAALFCALLLVCPSERAEADNTAARTALQKRYDQWSAAYLKNDVATLLRILSPDFSLKTGSGRVLTRPQYEVILRKRKPGTSLVTAYATRVKRLELSRDGNTAMAYTTETTTEKSPPVPDGKKAAPVIHIHDYRDGWVRRNGQWLLRSSETLEERSHS